MLQKTIYDIVAEDKRGVDRQIRNVLQQSEDLYMVNRLTKCGDIIPLEVRTRSFLYQGCEAIIMVGRDIRERRRLEQEILQISEQERQQFGQELHDDIGQILAGIQMLNQCLTIDLQTKELPEAREAREIGELLKEANNRARMVARGLLSVSLESGLNDALGELADSISGLHGLEVQFSADEEVVEQEHTRSIQLYRIAQEALNNVAKHAQATIVHVELTLSEEHIILSVRDNGIGVPVSTGLMKKGIGMRIMNYRAQSIGGSLDIISEEGKGTVVRCRIPENDWTENN